jgi:lipopolysaccharide/colanic/teichoic acid biosynthesis glycosyltransferase
MMRFFDIVISFLAILVVGPFMVPVIIGLLLTGEHHVLYLQTRIGRGGKEFSVLKFATMLKNSPNLPGGFITQKDDPRITPLGKILRLTKINELPQLINVLIGQMSIVGPRPVVGQHLDLYSADSREVILRQRPGITGMASLVFRDEERILNTMPGDRAANHDGVIAPYKGMLELWYGNNNTIRIYFAIILYTALAVLFPRRIHFLDRFDGLPEVPFVLRKYLVDE